MAFEIGVAANHVDLWDKLLAFLTTNDDLVASGQNWTVGWQAPQGAANETDLVLVGPGMGGTDQIYVGMRRVDNPATNHYSIHLSGNTGLLPSANTYEGHINSCTRVGMYLDANPMPYWFVANGRRFSVVIRISTVYEALHAGLFLPYADPLTYPYPLYIGGSVSGDLILDTAYSWTNTSGGHSAFGLFSTSSTSSNIREPSAWMLPPEVTWRRVENNTTSGISVNLMPFRQGGYYGQETGSASNYPLGAYAQLNNRRPCLGGGYALEPITLASLSSPVVTFGILDGIYHVPTEGNAAENIVTVDGVDHLVFQNAWRTGDANLFALALE